MSKSKTTLYGVTICFIINLILFPIMLYKVRTFRTSPQYITELLILVLSPILFYIGGRLLYQRKYGKDNNRKVTLGRNLKMFLEKYGLVAILSLLLCFFWYYDGAVYDRIAEELFQLSVRGQIPYTEFPAWKIFIIENLSSYSVFSYLIFTFSYFWRKAKLDMA